VSSATKGAPPARDYKLPEGSGWANAWKYFLGVGIAALGVSLLAGYGVSANQQRFAFSYLFAFFLFLTFGLGALFFVMVQYLTKAGWSVTVRRTAEFFMAGLPVFAVLVIPVILTMGWLFPWTSWPTGDASQQQAMAEQLEQRFPEPKESALAQPAYDPAERADSAKAERQELAPPKGDKTDVEQQAGALKSARAESYRRAKEKAENEERAKKKGYLNTPFFLLRIVGYFAVWIFLAMRYFRWSTDQDQSKAVANTANAQQLAPMGLVLFGVTVGFAAFDFLMTLMPMWYSTIFGVQVFATTVVANLASLIVVSLLLQRSGILRESVTIEHYHDLGKLLFGWLVFWAYVSFAQFFLIWYGNIPEETVYFHRRWDDAGGSWWPVSLVIMVLHFGVPFWLLMSRNIKRRVQWLALGAVMLLVMHVVEIYWDVLPNFPGNGTYSFSPHWLDLTCFLGVGGVYLGVVLRLMAGYALIPLGDPRLVRALKFENA
jgi:hypothetical protein